MPRDVTDTIEEAVPSPQWTRRQYVSVEGALEHYQALLQLEDTGASGFDPERAAETAGVESSGDGYRQVGSDRLRQIQLLETALDAAQRRMRHDYKKSRFDNDPDDLIRALMLYHLGDMTQREVGHALGVTKQVAKSQYIERAAGYLESALKAQGLWEDSPWREDRSGYDAKQDYQKKDWTDDDDTG